MHAVIRRWNGSANLIEAMASSTEEVERVLAASQGFVSYHAVRSGDTLVTLTVCRDVAGTEDSTRRAVAWLREKFTPEEVQALKPEIVDGDLFISFAAPERIGTSARA